jgi:hypothetical protein
LKAGLSSVAAREKTSRAVPTRVRNGWANRVKCCVSGKTDGRDLPTLHVL